MAFYLDLNQKFLPSRKKLVDSELVVAVMNKIQLKDHSSIFQHVFDLFRPTHLISRYQQMSADISRYQHFVILTLKVTSPIQSRDEFKLEFSNLSKPNL